MEEFGATIASLAGAPTLTLDASMSEEGKLTVRPRSPIIMRCNTLKVEIPLWLTVATFS